MYSYCNADLNVQIRISHNYTLSVIRNFDSELENYDRMRKTRYLLVENNIQQPEKS